MTSKKPRIVRSAQRPRVLMALGYYDHQLHRGIVRHARDAGWILDTSMAHYGVIPDHWQGDGIITMLLPGRNDIADYLRRQRVPVVAISNDVPETRVPRVCLDNRQIGRLAAEHLIERGFKNLAFYKFSDIADVCGREVGFREAVEAASLRYVALDWHSASTRRAKRNWFEWLTRQLGEVPKPLGVMAQSDNRASHFISACETAGLGVPEQVAVVGVDNDEYACELAPVPISSVDSNREGLAYDAATLLGRLMAGAAAPGEPVIVQPKGVVVRKSSDILAIQHKAVARALSFIWQRFAEPIGVEEVIQASMISRCGLYRAFEKHVGRSVGDELARKRIEHAQRLLVETDAKLHSIAGASGFSGGEHFSRVFTRIVAETPSAYRQRMQKTHKA